MYETRAVSIGELLSQNSFRIPDYQRPYSWDEDKALDLYSDIHECLENNRSAYNEFDSFEPYFMGSIVCAYNGLSQPLDVVDGQQRITTITTLLAILRDKIRQQGHKVHIDAFIWRPPNPHYENGPQPRLRLRESDQPRFQELVQQPNATTRLPIDDNSISIQKIITSAHLIVQEIGLVDEQYLIRLVRFILEKCFVIHIRAPDKLAAYRIFRSLNSRGQPLEPIDIIRAEVIGPTAITRPELSQAWSAAENTLGAIDLQTYVEAVVDAVYPRQGSDDLVEKFKHIMRVPALSVTLMRRMESFLKSHVAIEGGEFDFGEDSEIIGRRMDFIRAYEIPDWRACTLQYLTEGPSSANFLKFIKRIDALCLSYIVNAQGKARRARRFKEIQDWIVSGRNVFAATSPLSLTDAEVNQCISKLSGRLHPTPPYLRKILLRINAEMCTAVMRPYFPPNITIEHILPQNPLASWSSSFPNEEERKRLTFCLGNLSLLTRGANPRARNNAFHVKKERIFGIEDNNAFPITANICSFQEWTPATIQERQAALLGIVRSILSPA